MKPETALASVEDRYPNALLDDLLS